MHLHVVQLVLIDLVESLVFFLAGILTSVSLTVLTILLAVDSLLEALLDGELLLKDTSMFLSEHMHLSTFSIFFRNLHYYPIISYK